MTPTSKSYEEDPMARRFTAEAVRLDGAQLVLDRTLFYPTGGGQPCDEGIVIVGGRAYKVAEVRKNPAQEIIHVLSEAPDPGSINGSVQGEIDGDLRQVHARLHTALHVLTAVVQQRFEGTLVTGAQIKSDGTARMDFDLEGVPKSELRELEAELTGALQEDRKVVARYIDADEAASTPNLYRSRDVEPPTASGRVRVVEIEGLDRQACGGTHVSATRECGPVYFKKVYSKGRGNRRIVIGLGDMA